MAAMAAMTEESLPMTLQQRIAALNAAHMEHTPGDSQFVPPSCPPMPMSTKGRVLGNRVDSVNGIKATPPPLPVRKAPPPLPARKDSPDSGRRPSLESMSSTLTSGSGSETSRSIASRSTSGDRIKAPAWGETELPPLSPRGHASQPKKYSIEKPKYVSRAPSSEFRSAVAPRQPSQPNLPPTQPLLPPRRPKVEQSTAPGLAPSPLSYALNKPQTVTIPLSHSTVSQSRPQSQPPSTLNSIIQHPPLPSHPSDPNLATLKPDISAILATKPKPRLSPKPTILNLHSQSGTAGYEPACPEPGCLVCRDFSHPDSHAAQFARQSVNSVQDLAVSLTSPFPSATDKARAICTWLHLNIAYDVDNFFRGTLSPSTPESTLQSGLAVCEGYAQLLHRLATYAGLESVVISGHGKGFGFVPLEPGSAPPSFNSNHAWNAVKIDGGEWKLIDPCWYSGHVQGQGLPYVARRNDSMFSMSNEEFGIKHFPTNKAYSFTSRVPAMEWDEYIQINPDHWPYGIQPPTIYTNAEEQYFIGKRTVTPTSGQINIRQGGSVRFQFGLRCPHWDLGKHTNLGPPPVFLMQIQGVDGQKQDLIPFEHVASTEGKGGDVWYVDIPAVELGAAGQKVTCYSITSFGDRADCRGLSVAEFREKRGRIGMRFSGVMTWDLVQ